MSCNPDVIGDLDVVGGHQSLFYFLFLRSFDPRSIWKVKTIMKFGIISLKVERRWPSSRSHCYPLPPHIWYQIYRHVSQSARISFYVLKMTFGSGKFKNSPFLFIFNEYNNKPNSLNEKNQT